MKELTEFVPNSLDSEYFEREKEFKEWAKGKYIKLYMPRITYSYTLDLNCYPEGYSLCGLTNEEVESYQNGFDRIKELGDVETDVEIDETRMSILYDLIDCKVFLERYDLYEDNSKNRLNFEKIKEFYAKLKCKGK